MTKLKASPSWGTWVQGNRHHGRCLLMPCACIWFRCSAKPVTLRRADPVTPGFPSQNMQLIRQVSNRKTHPKGFQVHFDLRRFPRYCLVSRRLMKESAQVCGAQRLGNMWTSRCFHTKTWRHHNSGQVTQQSLPPFSHFWAENSPQENAMWAGIERYSRLRNSDRRKSNGVKANSRVAERRRQSEKRGESDNPALCCQMVNQVTPTPFQTVGKRDCDQIWIPTSFLGDHTSSNMKQMRYYISLRRAGESR